MCLKSECLNPQGKALDKSRYQANIFSYFSTKHKLLVLIRNASLRHF